MISQYYRLVSTSWPVSSSCQIYFRFSPNICVNSLLQNICNKQMDRILAGLLERTFNFWRTSTNFHKLIREAVRHQMSRQL